jgi:hypothetical protein
MNFTEQMLHLLLSENLKKQLVLEVKSKKDFNKFKIYNADRAWKHFYYHSQYHGEAAISFKLVEGDIYKTVYFSSFSMHMPLDADLVLYRYAKHNK